MDQSFQQTRILFVCVENAGRSQMAESFAKRKGSTLQARELNPPSQSIRQ